MIAGAWLRLSDVGAALLFGDEFHSLRAVARGYRYVLTEYGAHGSGLAFPLLQWAISGILGLSNWTLRMPAWAGGVSLLLLLPALGRRMVGWDGATVATLLASTTASLVFYSHFGRAYALVACLGFLLLFLLQGVVDGRRLSRRRALGLAALAALLPWLHLTSLAFVLGVVGASVVALLLHRGRLREALAVLAAASVGLGAAVVIHLPALDSLRRFAEKRTEWEYFGSFGATDVATLLVGSRPAAWVALGLVGLALPAWVVVRRLRSLPLIAACVTPAVALLVVNPYGDPYAYARYLLVSVAPACLAVGWGVSEIARRTLAERTRPVVATATGVGLALGLALSGLPAPGGPHANAYLALHPLPAFDVPFDAAPAFYRELARDPDARRIVEAPALTNRARHLYRNYWLAHRKETFLAPFPEELPVVPAGPYVSLSDPGWREGSGADYFILHLDPVAEVAQYWRFVYARYAAASANGVAAFMERHGRYDPLFDRASSRLRSRLRQELGEPVFKDAWIEVWRLRNPRGPRTPSTPQGARSLRPPQSEARARARRSTLPMEFRGRASTKR